MQTYITVHNMKKTLIFSSLFFLLLINCHAQCDIMKVEIKDSVALKALTEYIVAAQNAKFLTPEKGIVLLNISKENSGIEYNYRICITNDNHYIEYRHPYVNYTVIEGVIFLIEYAGSRNKIDPSATAQECINKIVGNKVKPFPRRVELLTTLPSGQKVTQRAERILDIKKDGSYYFDGKGNYQFKEGL